MESMRRAEPYEQTAAQFHNRPDVFVHGRYERTMPGSRELDLHEGNTEITQGFHAGTERSAHERLDVLGPAWERHSPRFYHGRVDPAQMQNTAVPGNWENKAPKALGGGVVRHYDDPGRVPDEGEGWGPRHHGSYYRNDYEDKGSTSVILPLRERGAGPFDRVYEPPQNFKTHRETVSDALKAGKPVPSHVREPFLATGGEFGPKSVTHTHFEARYKPVFGKGYNRYDEPITGLAAAGVGIGVPW